MPGLDPLAEVRDLLAREWPGYQVNSVSWLGEGQENAAFEVNGELVLRRRKESDPAERSAQVSREVALLKLVADLDTLPTPVPLLAIPEQGWLAYAKLPGRPLIELPPDRWASGVGPIAAALGGLLATLHAVPVEQVDQLVEVDDQPLVEWLSEAGDLYPDIRSEVPTEDRQHVDAFLAAPVPLGEHRQVFSHNDLGFEHVLVDPESCAVTGIIDWSDAAIDDPAYDFGLILRDLGQPALDAALASYAGAGRSDLESLEQRALFYARCTVLEDLAYGLKTGHPEFVDRSVRALPRLFAD